MKVLVIGRYQDVRKEDVEGKNVAVIDVFRTTSVIVTALENGASCIIPAETINKARTIGVKMDDSEILYAGERNALPIEGFHLDNSPFSYMKESIKNKTIIMTTSNGTKAIRSGRPALHLYIASFLNTSAVVDVLEEQGNDVTIICAGTLGMFSLEDGICAGFIASSLAGKIESVEITDLAWAMKHLVESGIDVKKALEQGSYAYSRLLETGYEKDVEYCISPDTSRTVPILTSDGWIEVL